MSKDNVNPTVYSVVVEDRVDDFDDDGEEEPIDCYSRCLTSTANPAHEMVSGDGNLRDAFTELQDAMLNLAAALGELSKRLAEAKREAVRKRLPEAEARAAMEAQFAGFID
mgnify:CR=1 FL=1